MRWREGSGVTTLANFAPASQWVAWRNEVRAGNPTKVPYVAPNRKAEADDPSGWLTHDDAAKLAQEIANGTGGSVGIELGGCGQTWLAGVDLDTCRNPQSGVLEPWAEEVLQRLGSYAEISPSQTGVKVFFTVDPMEIDPLRELMGTKHGRLFKRAKGGRHPPAIELHISNRFFAVTWDGLADQPEELRCVRLNDLRWLVKEAGPALAGKTTNDAPGDGNGDNILSRLNRLASNDRRVGTALRNAATMTGGSRSEGAFGLGGALRRAGWSFADMKAALLACPATRDWAEEQGAAGDRQFQRIWERSDSDPGQDKPGTNEQDRRRLTVLRPADCVGGNPRPYIVKGLLARGDLAVIAGQPGSGKSLLAPHLGYSVATGIAAFGRRVRQGGVLYLAPEDGAGMRMRVRALFQSRGDAPIFVLVPDAIDLRDSNSPDLAAVEGLIRELEPVLVVIDTVARAFPGLKENESDEMGRVVTVARGLTTICDSAVLLLHHLPKDGSTPRGHGSLNGDADLTLIVEGKGNEPRTVSLLKNRNGPSDATFSFTVGTEMFGEDEDGDPIIAAIATEADTFDAAAGKKKLAEVKLRDDKAVLLRHIRDAITEAGKMVSPAPGMPVVNAVPRASLRRILVEKSWFDPGLLPSSASNCCEGGDKAPALARKGYGVENKGLQTLQRNGLAAFNRDWVWLL